MTGAFARDYPTCPASLQVDIERADFRCLYGNPNVAGCELGFGWVIRVGRHTCPDERKWLRAQGFRFSGGTWWIVTRTEVACQSAHGGT